MLLMVILVTAHVVFVVVWEGWGWGQEGLQKDLPGMLFLMNEEKSFQTSSGSAVKLSLDIVYRANAR